MTASFDGLFASHIGFVVRDIEATGAGYERLLGIPHWHIREVDCQAIPWKPGHNRRPAAHRLRADARADD